MGIAASSELDFKQVFQHALAPVPTSMFKDNGNMRITKTKSTLKNKLQVKQPVRTVCKQPASLPEVTIIDGCALLWVISWPSQGVVQDYIDNFIHYIKQKLAKGDVYLVFDRYNEYSIKDAARCCREETGSKKYKLRPDTTLPKKTIVLTVTTNKVQLIDVICQQLCVKIQNCLYLKKVPCTNLS